MRLLQYRFLYNNLYQVLDFVLLHLISLLHNEMILYLILSHYFDLIVVIVHHMTVELLFVVII